MVLERQITGTRNNGFVERMQIPRAHTLASEASKENIIQFCSNRDVVARRTTSEQVFDESPTVQLQFLFKSEANHISCKAIWGSLLMDSHLFSRWALCTIFLVHNKEVTLSCAPQENHDEKKQILGRVVSASEVCSFCLLRASHTSPFIAALYLLGSISSAQWYGVPLHSPHN